MGYAKLLAVAVVITAAMGGMAAQAAATVMTSPAGTQIGAGTTIHFKEKNGKWKFTMTSDEIECSKFTMHIDATTSGGTLQTIDLDVTQVKQEECDAAVTVLKGGTIEYHTLSFPPPGRVTVTWTGLELKTEPFPGITCIYTTSNTDVGSVSGGTPAVFNLSGTIPRTGGSFLCGSSATMTAEYEATSPGTLIFD